MTSTKGPAMAHTAKYGKFNEKENCFELHNEPPRKWVNLHYNKIGDNEYYSECTNIGDGWTWTRDKDGRTCLLVNWDNKYLYVRDEESGTVFSPWGQPAATQTTDNVCRYYAAKTEIQGTCKGLEVTQRVFVPADHVAEAWTVTIRNKTNRARKVSVFGYAMFQLSGCDHEGNTVWKDNFAEVHKDICGVLVTNRNTSVPTDRFKGFITTLNTKQYKGASAYRDHFTRSDFGYGAPKILWGWNADNKPGFGPDCAGIVQVTLTVKPKSTGRSISCLARPRDSPMSRRCAQVCRPRNSTSSARNSSRKSCATRACSPSMWATRTTTA